MTEHEIIPRQHFVDPDRRVYLAVMYDGEVIWNAPRQSRQVVHTANLIIVSEPDGFLVVWKERFGLVPTGITVTPEQAGLLAAAYVIMSSEEEAMRDFAA